MSGGQCESWEESSLDKMAEVVDPHPSHRAPPESRDGIPFPGIGDLAPNGDIDLTSCRMVDPHVYVEHKRRYELEAGDIGFGRVASIGKVVSFNRDFLPFAVSPTLAIIKPSRVDAGFLRQYLQGPPIAEQIGKLLTGTTRSSLGLELLRKLRINAPKRPEQAKIAEILSTLDRMIEQTEALLAKRGRIQTGLMQCLLKRGIDEDGSLRSESIHQFKESPLGRIPIEWEVKQLEDCVEFLDGERVPLKQADRDAMEGDYPYYGASGIIDYIDRYLFDENLILLGEDGENVVSRHLPLAFQVTGKVWVNNHAHVLKPKTDQDIDFLTERLEFYDYSLLVSGSAQPKLNQRNLRKMLLPMPGGPEQRLIGLRLRSMRRSRLVDAEHVSKLSALKRGLMQDLLTGRKCVRSLLELEHAH